MSIKVWIYSILTYVLLTVGLIILFSHIWQEDNVITKIGPWIISAIITHFFRKIFDFIPDVFNHKSEKPFLGVFIKVDHASRRFAGFGATCGEIIPAGNFKANYEVEAELNVSIQNESPYTVYELDVTYIPNQYSSNYTLRDTRDNKIQPLEGNKHVDFVLRITNHYYDVYASDVDMDLQKLYKIGNDLSLLNGSKFNLKYRDSKHKAHFKTEVLV